MKFEDAVNILQGLPYTSPLKGRFFYDFVVENRIRSILELGFAHGVSTCYFAAAARHTGGHIDTVDRHDAKFDPSIESLLELLSLKDIVSVHRETSSYTWFLKKQIEKLSQSNVCQPQYDLVFIDGPKDWTNDGAAFFMAEKLLRPLGWIIFDDYSWSYRRDESRRQKKHDVGYIFSQMSEDEFREPQIQKIFHLLVMQHPNFSDFRIVDDSLAIARKTCRKGPKQMIITTNTTIVYRLKRLAKHVLCRSC